MRCREYLVGLWESRATTSTSSDGARTAAVAEAAEAAAAAAAAAVDVPDGVTRWLQRGSAALKSRVEREGSRAPAPSAVQFCHAIANCSWSTSVAARATAVERASPSTWWLSGG